jgi:hypothetical protein
MPAGIELDFVEGETECTGEKAWGQFSIFGAIEENLCHGFSRIDTDKKIFEGFALRRAEGCDSEYGEDLRAASGREGKRVVHRACTGNAERAVDGCQLLAASFSLLGITFRGRGRIFMES